jgi:hypothetical protein
LLIDCIQRAGLSGLGIALDQNQLARAARAYSSAVHPQFLTSKLFRRGLGDVYQTGPNAGQQVPSGVLQVQTDVPPDPITIFQEIPKPPPAAPTFVSPNYAPLPTVSASTLLQAAALPGAPSSVVAASQQLQSSGFSLSSLSGWFTGQMISGVPNYLLAGGAAVLLLVLAAKGRR